jgi:hypothetical protein
MSPVSRRDLLGRVAVAATMPATAALSAGVGGSPDMVAGLHPDARLLAVAALAFQAREVELATHGDEGALAAACDVTDGLVREMATIPATTLEGFRAKAQAADWYGLWDNRKPDGDLTIDDVATRSLIRDLLA